MDTFVVFFVLARGAVGRTSHLHVAVDVGFLRNFGIKTHFLPAFRRRDVRPGVVVAAVVRAEEAVDLELALRRDVPEAPVQGSGSYSRAQPPAVLRVLQGLQDRVPRRVCEPLPGHRTVQTSLHQYHLLSYPLHH